MIIELPWPDKLLWPNGSEGNRFAKAKARKAAKEAAQWATIQARMEQGQFVHDGGEVRVRVYVHAKPRGPLPDKDNVIAAMKASFDGIAKEIGIDDRHFAAPIVEFEAPRDGRIIVVVGGGE